jgi:hypothetical protein
MQAKIERVHAARMRAESFIFEEGDLQSEEAASIGLELQRSCNDLCSEFGPQSSDKLKTV